jgi:response regulator RpfG family c-di-GMP phosphodiesterase
MSWSVYSNLLERRSTAAIMEALSQSLALREPDIAARSRRLVPLAMTIARWLGCAENSIVEIGCAALLHNIGRLSLPDTILRNPGLLTAPQWTLMRHVPDLGANLLTPWPQFAPVATIIRAHREHYDGRGYPRGLRGSSIPLGARIVASVDAYGAMTSERRYQASRSHLSALAELGRCAGSQFDPAVVAAVDAVFATGAPAHGNTIQQPSAPMSSPTHR